MCQSKDEQLHDMHYMLLPFMDEYLTLCVYVVLMFVCHVTHTCLPTSSFPRPFGLLLCMVRTGGETISEGQLSREMDTWKADTVLTAPETALVGHGSGLSIITVSSPPTMDSMVTTTSAADFNHDAFEGTSSDWNDTLSIVTLPNPMTVVEMKERRLSNQRERSRRYRAAETEEQKAARREAERLKRSQQRALERSLESEAERAERREINRLRQLKRRSTETDEQKVQRRKAQRDRVAQKRASETEEQKAERKRRQRERVAQKRASETEEQKAERKSIQRERVAQKRATDTEEQRSKQRVLQHEKRKSRRSIGTEEERAERRANGERQVSKRADKTAQQRAAKLEANSRRVAQKRASETPEQREKRLKANRERLAKRRAEAAARKAEASKVQDHPGPIDFSPPDPVLPSEEPAAPDLADTNQPLPQLDIFPQDFISEVEGVVESGSTTTGSKGYKCLYDDCAQEFTTMSNFWKHILLHCEHDVTPSQGTSGRTTDTVDRHTDEMFAHCKVTSSLKDSLLPCGEMGRSCKCSHCGKAFAKSADLAKHILYSLLNDCQLDKDVMPTTHQDVPVENPLTTPTTLTPSQKAPVHYKCQRCDEHFHSPSVLLKHVLTHTEENLLNFKLSHSGESSVSAVTPGNKSEQPSSNDGGCFFSYVMP